jgi:ABC-type uncharacterized transport system ATPase subunit
MTRLCGLAAVSQRAEVRDLSIEEEPEIEDVARWIYESAR